ncbi:MAG: hypothetical protein Q7U34_12435, partial [Anaerolineales bacterium]|nr:hypothetical protein [Anaerolineales bacterium]
RLRLGQVFAPEGSPSGKYEILRTLEKRQGAHIVPMSFRRMTGRQKKKQLCASCGNNFTPKELKVGGGS